MTAPRPLYPGSTYRIARATDPTARVLLLHQDLHQAFDYLLSEAAARYQIQLHAWSVSSGGYEAVVRDPEGHLSAFLAYFHGMLARAVMERLQRTGGIWLSRPVVITELGDSEAIVDAMVTLVGGAKSKFAPRSHQRNGDVIRRVVERPSFFFQEGTLLPKRVCLVPVEPQNVPQGVLRTRLADAENITRASLERGPHFAASTPSLWTQMHDRFRRFLDDHAFAREGVLYGFYESLFPRGTNKFRQLGMRVEGDSAPRGVRGYGGMDPA